MCFLCVSDQEWVSGTVGPTLPGGLVVRIRRSHRRGPGSIPGQGTFSSFSLHLHSPPPFSSSLRLPFDQHLLTPTTQLQLARTRTYTNTHTHTHTHTLRYPVPYRHPSLHRLLVCTLPILFPHYQSGTVSPLAHNTFAPLRLTGAASPTAQITHPTTPQADLSHTPPGSQTLFHSRSLHRTPSAHRLLLALEQTHQVTRPTCLTCLKWLTCIARLACIACITLSQSALTNSHK